MVAGRAVLRLTAVMFTAAFGVHELRYLIWYGGDAQQTLAHEGHGYLALTAGLLGLVVTAALATVLLSVARTGPGRRPAALRARALWPLASVGLVTIYTSQELAEGILATGHPEGLAGVFGAGGWLVLPLAVIAGAAVTLCVKVVRMVEEHHRGLMVADAWTSLQILRSMAFAGTCRAVLVGRLVADHLVGRGPPPLLRLP